MNNIISKETMQDFLSTVPTVLYEYVLYSESSSELLYMSPMSLELLGHEPDYFVADMGRFWQMIHPDDLERLQSEDVEANKGNEFFYSTVRFMLPTGIERWIQISSKPTSRKKQGAVIWSGYIVDITKNKQLELEKTKLIESLENAIEEIKTLQGIIPICSYCHGIRNDQGAWEQLEAYVSKHSEAKFSHSICPDCLPKVKREIDDL